MEDTKYNKSNNIRFSTPIQEKKKKVCPNAPKKNKVNENIEQKCKKVLFPLKKVKEKN